VGAIAAAVFLMTQPAAAETLEVIGYAGALGEWELSGNVLAKRSWLTTEYAGRVTMTHVGICTQDGPEEKAGDLQLRKSVLSSRLSGTLRTEGADCTFTAELSDGYTGALQCPERAPTRLKLWLR
jgi:hypothetical protein